MQFVSLTHEGPVQTAFVQTCEKHSLLVPQVPPPSSTQDPWPSQTLPGLHVWPAGDDTSSQQPSGPTLTDWHVRGKSQVELWGQPEVLVVVVVAPPPLEVLVGLAPAVPAAPFLLTEPPHAAP